MIDSIKGKLSAKLLASSSTWTTSQASLLAALGLSVFIIVVAAVVAIAQWKVTRNLVQVQKQRVTEMARRIDAAAEMATQQANAHRSTLNALLSRDSDEFNEANALRQSNLHDYTRLSLELGNAEDLHDAAQNLRVLTGQYEELSGQVIDLFREGRTEDALELRVQRLRGLFNQWQGAQENFLTQLARVNQRQDSDYARMAAISGRWLIGLLLAPLALIVLGVAGITAILGAQRIGSKKSDVWSR